jgi:hypothetical protein
MPKPKSDKSIKSINFENEVLSALEERCSKNNIEVSTFVNRVIRRIVMSEYEYYRHQAKLNAIELAKNQMLMNTAVDRPEFKRNDEITIKIGDED